MAIVTLIYLSVSGRQPDELIGRRDDGLLIYTALPAEKIEEYIFALRASRPGVTVTYRLFDEQALIAQLHAEQDAPRADVLWGVSADLIQELGWSGLLLPYAPAGLERLPANFRDNADPPTWVGLNITLTAFCVNRALLTERGLDVPQGWADLLDPAYAGLIAVPDPRLSGYGFATLLVFESLYGEAGMWRQLSALDANVQSYSATSAAACEAAGSGAAAIGIADGITAISGARADAAISAVFPAEGLGWEMVAAALVRKFPVDPAAQELIDFAISDGAMYTYGLTSALTAVPVPHLRAPAGFPADPRALLIDKDMLWAGANRARLTAEWARRFAPAGEGAP